MTLEIVNSDSEQYQPSVVMLVYGSGGVGKTTFASTAPKPILADCENGAKYFGLRGIKAIPIARIRSWMDFVELHKVIKEKNEYETVIIDPIGELMEKLTQHMINKADSKLVQKDGSPTMAGWGWLKKTLRDSLKIIRDTGKHVIIIAHVQEKDDDGKIVKRPLVATKLSEELVNMVDIVGYMTTMKTADSEESKRVIQVEPDSDRFVAKDRTGQLGNIIPPDFSLIIQAAQGTGDFKWTKKKVKKEEPAKPEAEGGAKQEPKKEDEQKPGADAPKIEEPKKPRAPEDIEGMNDKTRGRLDITREDDLLLAAEAIGVDTEKLGGYPDTVAKASTLFAEVLAALGAKKKNGKGQQTIA